MFWPGADPGIFVRGSNLPKEDGVAQSVEHWTANLATRVRSPVGEEPSDLICAFLHVQMESNWAGLSVCNCRHTGKWCGTIKAVGNTDHTRQTWIHMQTPLSPLAGCGPVGEGTSGKVLNWTVRSLNHAYTTTNLPKKKCQEKKRKKKTTKRGGRGLLYLFCISMVEINMYNIGERSEPEK